MGKLINELSIVIPCKNDEKFNKKYPIFNKILQ